MPLPNAFEVSELFINGEALVAAGTIDPSAVGYAAPRGSLFLRANGESWKKIGSADVDWLCLAFEGSDGGGGGIQIPLRTITVTKDVTVDYDVAIVVCNHYYEEGIEVTLEAPNYYQHPITVKNLTYFPVTIKLKYADCRVDGKKSYQIKNRLSSVTLEALGNDFIVTSVVEGECVTIVASNCNCCGTCNCSP